MQKPENYFTPKMLSLDGSQGIPANLTGPMPAYLGITTSTLSILHTGATTYHAKPHPSYSEKWRAKLAKPIGSTKK